MKATVKKITLKIVAVLALFSMAVPCAAKEVVNNCDTIAPPAGVQYSNLCEANSHLSKLGIDNFPDTTGFGLENNGKEGVMILEVTGAQKVSVSVFSNKGTYAVIGESGPIVGSQGSGQKQELLYSPSKGKVYLKTENGKGKEMVYYNVLAVYTFPGEAVPLPEDVVRYGLNVYASQDGTSYQAAKVSLIEGKRYDGRFGNALYYDTYQANLPEGSRYIMVTVNDFATIMNNKGSLVQNTMVCLVGICSVTVTAADDPPPAASETPRNNNAVGGNIRPVTPSVPQQEKKPAEKDNTGFWASYGGNTSPAVPYYGGSTVVTAPEKSEKEKPASTEKVEPKEENAAQEGNVISTQPVYVPPMPEETSESSPKTIWIAVCAALVGASAVLLLFMLLKSVKTENESEEETEKKEQ